MLLYTYMNLKNYLIILSLAVISSMIPFLHAGVQHGLVAILLSSLFSLYLINHKKLNNLSFFALNLISTYFALLIQVSLVYKFYAIEDFNSVLYFYSVTATISIVIYNILLLLLRNYTKQTN